MNTSERSFSRRKVKLLKDKEIRNKYVIDQIKIGLRNQLRTLRDARGLTQAELAELTGTKQSVISRMERNPVSVGMTTYLDIARAFDVTFVARFEAIDTFIDWYDNPSQKKMTPPESNTVLAKLEASPKAKSESAAPKAILQDWLANASKTLREERGFFISLWVADEKEKELVTKWLYVDREKRKRDRVQQQHILIDSFSNVKGMLAAPRRSTANAIGALSTTKPLEIRLNHLLNAGKSEEKAVINL